MTPLKDRLGRTIGYIRAAGNREEVVDANCNRLGQYDPRTNTTTNRDGRIVGTGNLLTTFLADRVK